MTPRMMSHCLMLLVAVALSGCTKAFDAYYTSPKHFRFGTAKVRRMDKSLERAYEASLTALETHDWGVAKKEMGEDSALIRARKNERELILDIKGEGEASEVRAEMDQDGNDADLWGLLNEIDMLP